MNSILKGLYCVKKSNPVTKNYESTRSKDSDTLNAVADAPHYVTVPTKTYKSIMAKLLVDIVPNGSLWCSIIPKASLSSFVGNGIDTCLKAVSKELAALDRYLPCSPEASIFIRMEEGQLNRMKAIITGPAETPYAYGCFEFDLTFPINYPFVPPIVTFKTTDNCTIRFNPNLYKNGNVCLSLLGTWTGSPHECWQPYKSNILQPGYGVPNENCIKSIAYNLNVQFCTARFAILDQIRNANALGGGLEKVVRKHFQLNKEAVQNQLHEWAEKSKPMESKWENLLQELNVEFAKLNSAS